MCFVCSENIPRISATITHAFIRILVRHTLTSSQPDNKQQAPLPQHPIHRIKTHAKWIAIGLVLPSFIAIMSTAAGNLITEPIKALFPVNRSIHQVNESLLLAQRSDDRQHGEAAAKAYWDCLKTANTVATEYPKEARPMEVQGICYSYLANEERNAAKRAELLRKAAQMMKTAETLNGPDPLPPSSQLIYAASLDQSGDHAAALSHFEAALRQLKQKPEQQITSVDRDFMAAAAQRIAQLKAGQRP